MKRLYYAILLTLFSIISFHCQKEISYINTGGPGNGNNNPAPLEATLQGNIVDENDQPAADVTIHVGDKTAVTNTGGYFRILNAALDKNASLVTAEKAGYFKAFRTFSATSGANQVKIKLIKKESVGFVNAASGGTVSLLNGSKITLPANGIVKATGGLYTGNVNIYAAYINPTLSDIARIVPGSFLAKDKNDNRVILASYGMLAVELESSAGEKLQIAPGSTATLTTAIPTSLLASSPDKISLWYVDEQTGIWKEEGTAIKNRNSYTGEVKHFTYWNCDVAGPSVNLSATFKNLKDLPIVYAEIRIRPTADYASAHGYTDSLGQIDGPVPANTNLVLEVMSPCGTVIYSKNIGSFSSDVNLGTITVDNSASIVTIQGKLLDCNGNPVTDGYAIINYNNNINYISVQNAGGEFTTVFYTCTGLPSDCEILGVDAAGQQQGTAITVPVRSPITDAGNIITCGISTIQYINYNLNGADYSITSVTNDSLTSYTYPTQSTPAWMTWMSGIKIADNKYISLSFGHNESTGTYPLTALSVQGFDSVMVVQPSSVVLTNYPTAVGGFYEGTFSGQFKEASLPSTVHNISGSFRIRRR